MIVLALLPFARSVDGGSGVEVKKIAEGVSDPAIWNNTIAYVRDGTIHLYDGKEIDTGIKFSGTSYSWIELKEGKCVYPAGKKLTVYDIDENRSWEIDTRYNCTSAILWNDGIIYVEWELYHTPPTSGSRPKIYFYDFDTGEKTFIAEGQLPYIKSPVIRDYLPYWSMEEGWRVYELNRKREKPLSGFGAGAFRYASIYEDMIVYGSSMQIHVYDMEKNKDTFLCRGDPHSASIWGDNVVYVDPDGILVVFNLETMKRTPIQEVKKPGRTALYKNQVVWCDGEELYYAKIGGGES